MENHEWADLYERVLVWARENRPDDVNYGSPQSYWSAAYFENVITTEEYEYARDIFKDMFYYRGD